MRKLIVAPPAEEDEAAAWTTPAERAAAESFGTRQRRREYLAWRAAVRRELGRDTPIGYDAIGAPELPGSGLHLSVAHCPGRIAVCISDRRCAVDIEPAARDFSRMAHRCLTSGEEALSADPTWPGTAWCVKETLYKYAGRKGLDLRRDLRIERIAPDGRSVVGRIAGGEEIRIEIRCDGAYITTYIL